MSEQQTINLTATQLRTAINQALDSPITSDSPSQEFTESIIESIFQLFGTKQQLDVKEASSPDRYEYDEMWQFGPFFGNAKTKRVYPFTSNPNKFRVGNVELTIGPGDGHTFFVVAESTWVPKEDAYDKLREMYRDLVGRWAKELEEEPCCQTPSSAESVGV